MWNKYVLNSQAPTDVDSITQTVEAVFDALEKEGFNAIDLTKISVDHVSAEHLAAVLRTTSSFHEKIDGWKHALGICYVACNKEKKDPQDVLYGLVD